MGKEIERKYLVTGNAFKSQGKAIFIHQGFLSTEKERVVRVRIKGGKGYITIKGISVGVTRSEFEYEIPLKDAKYMLDNLCIKPTIEKHRYILDYKGFTWEVDEFHGENEGLVVAEIELPSEDTEFGLPDWIGKEVTDDPRYYNANLIARPYRQWREK